MSIDQRREQELATEKERAYYRVGSIIPTRLGESPVPQETTPLSRAIGAADEAQSALSSTLGALEARLYVSVCLDAKNRPTAPANVGRESSPMIGGSNAVRAIEAHTLRLHEILARIHDLLSSLEA